MFDVILDTLFDALKLLPFLFVTYLIMEYIEEKTGEGFNDTVSRAGFFGPFIGGLLGAFPQCGFSAAASNLYAGRVITMGTLIAIFLSTSDEMLPVFISEKVDIRVILYIIAIKIIIGAFWGFIVDLFFRKRKGDIDIEKLCEKEHCHCEEDEGILKPALIHTLHIFLFILAITFLINLVIFFVGEETLAGFANNTPFVGELVMGLIGLIPNCAASVVVTQLYLEGIIGFGAMMSGLLAGAGVGLLILFRVNDNKKQNLIILSILYAAGVISGFIIEITGIGAFLS